MTLRFTVTSAGRDPLGLAKMLEEFAAEQWVPAHYTREEAEEFVLDQFWRTVAAGLERVQVRAER